MRVEQLERLVADSRAYRPHVHEDVVLVAVRVDRVGKIVYGDRVRRGLDRGEVDAVGLVRAQDDRLDGVARLRRHVERVGLVQKSGARIGEVVREPAERSLDLRIRVDLVLAEADGVGEPSGLRLEVPDEEVLRLERRLRHAHAGGERLAAPVDARLLRLHALLFAPYRIVDLGAELIEHGRGAGGILRGGETLDDLRMAPQDRRGDGDGTCL